MAFKKSDFEELELKTKTEKIQMDGIYFSKKPYLL